MYIPKNIRLYIVVTYRNNAILNALGGTLRKSVGKFRVEGSAPFFDAAFRTLIRCIVDNREFRFDARRVIATEQIIFGAELDNDALKDEVLHCESVPLFILDRIFKAVPGPFEKYVFVDIGTGLGKPLFYACEKPFKRVIGIEISPELCDLCRENLTSFRPLKQSSSLPHPELVQGDATSFNYPDEDLLIFMFNPFGPKLMTAFLQNLENHHRRTGKRIYLAYYNPRFFNVIDRFDFLKPFDIPRPLLFFSTYNSLGLGIFEAVTA